MPQCDYCGSSILFGGKRNGDLRFCNDKCFQLGFLLTEANRVPLDLLAQEVQKIHQGDCPKCGGPGPVDVHTSHAVWSALALTKWSSKPQISCRPCGIKSKLGKTAFSMTLGWWGFPWGLIMTPVQVGRNVVGLFSAPDPTSPSRQLENLIKLQLAANLVRPTQQKNPPG